MFSDTRKHIEPVRLTSAFDRLRPTFAQGIFNLDGAGADLGERVQHPLPAFIGHVEERDRMRCLGEHPGEDAARVIEVGRSGERSADDDVPRYRGIE